MIVVTYLSLLALLALLCSHRLLMAGLVLSHWRKRKPNTGGSRFDPSKAQTILVQLPLYNEASVAERLIWACAQLDYPRSKLKLQVLDDSTDETQELLKHTVDEVRDTLSVDIEYVHRDDRSGYKAGALANGLRISDSELVAIFDADFIPPPDFLTRLVPHFNDSDVGLVQARWSHLNRDDSLLCRVQALLLDGHFRCEQLARSVSGRFFNFNGTAGIWRRAAIEAAGSWHSDTLTEDLDLSLRSQLTGWRFVYVDDVAAPSELPETLRGFRSQQYRWVKGAGQNLKKLVGLIWGTPGVPLKARVEATSQLTLNISYLLVTILCVLSVPVLLDQSRILDHTATQIAEFALVIFTTICIFLFYGISQRSDGLKGLVRTVALTPFVYFVGIGLAVHNSVAFLVGLTGHQSEFVRTPKHGNKRKSYAVKQETVVPALELCLGIYCLYASLLALSMNLKMSGAFMLLEAVSLFSFGFLTLSGLKLPRSSASPSHSTTIKPEVLQDELDETLISTHSREISVAQR